MKRLEGVEGTARLRGRRPLRRGLAKARVEAPASGGGKASKGPQGSQASAWSQVRRGRFQHQLHRLGEAAPRRDLFLEAFAAGGGEPVEACPAFVVGFPPVGRDQPLMFEPIAPAG